MGQSPKQWLNWRASVAAVTWFCLVVSSSLLLSVQCAVLVTSSTCSLARLIGSSLVLTSCLNSFLGYWFCHVSLSWINTCELWEVDCYFYWLLRRCSCSSCQLVVSFDSCYVNWYELTFLGCQLIFFGLLLLMLDSLLIWAHNQQRCCNKANW